MTCDNRCSLSRQGFHSSMDKYLGCCIAFFCSEFELVCAEIVCVVFFCSEFRLVCAALVCVAFFCNEIFCNEIFCSEFKLELVCVELASIYKSMNQ